MLGCSRVVQDGILNFIDSSMSAIYDRHRYGGPIVVLDAFRRQRTAADLQQARMLEYDGQVVFGDDVRPELVRQSATSVQIRNLGSNIATRRAEAYSPKPASSLADAVPSQQGRSRYTPYSGWRMHPMSLNPNGNATRGDALVDVSALAERLRNFARERAWEQFHSPKNLAMALTGEVGELVEIFQWMTEAESGGAGADPRTASRVREELADVLVYLVRLADVLQIDLNSAVVDKLATNAAKYPVDQSHGTSAKYTEIREQRSRP